MDRLDGGNVETMYRFFSKAGGAMADVYDRYEEAESAKKHFQKRAGELKDQLDETNVELKKVQELNLSAFETITSGLQTSAKWKRS